MAFLPAALKTPMGQVILIGIVCFCCPGMFSALTGMGGGGQVDPRAADAALTALYATFALFGLLGGGFHNLMGPRVTVLLGSIFYALYAASFLNYNQTQNAKLVVAAGGLLGFGAGLLWAGQGAILLAYPPKKKAGLYISIFWSVFNMGGVVGGFIPFLLNFRNEKSSSVNDSTYIAFMVVMLLGSLLCLGLVDPGEVVREEEPDDDQGNPLLESVDSEAPLLLHDSETTLTTELCEILKLFSDYRMLAFAPACIASNFFYTYQFNNVNGVLFNVRTRGLNNIVYWAAQMVGSLLAGRLLDKFKALIGIVSIATVSALTWGGALANQLRYSRQQIPEVVDFTDGAAFLGPFVLYSCFGLLDAMYQTLCYWIMAEMSSDVQRLSRYSGFYKGLQSAGAAIAWQLDAKRTPFMTQLLLNWILMTISFPLLGLTVRNFPGQNREEQHDDAAAE